MMKGINPAVHGVDEAIPAGGHGNPASPSVFASIHVEQSPGTPFPAPAVYPAPFVS